MDAIAAAGLNPFFITVENVPAGLGFKLFGAQHLLWLAATVAIAVALGLWYRRATEKQRSALRYTFAALLIADELFKIVCLCIMGQYMPKYLPLHLCSINIFIIAAYAVKQSDALKNFLYLVCTAGALMALLFPAWTALPATSFMYWHSFSVHLLLVAFPLILTIGGEIHPDVRALPKAFLVLGGFAVVALIVNLIWGTNFMFLMYAEPGNPLYFFQQAFGSHLIGFPVLIAALVAVFMGPWYIADKVKAKRAAA